MSSIDEIKARIDIVDLVSETVQLRRSGKNYTGFCPFHTNTRTPAFVVFPESGTWRCFGQCADGGDIFGYVMKKEGWDFTETLRFLAEKAGIQLKTPTPQEQAVAEESDRLRELLEEAVTFYRHHLLNTPHGKEALDYLHRRGLTGSTIVAFGLGYAPNAWEAALTHFKSRGYTDQDLIDAGLATPRDSEGDSARSGIYDRFRSRIIFPIRDDRGRMSGFGARILNPEDVPKFLNSPQSAIFDKSSLLYGLDRARKAIRLMDRAVIVEGYLDVIALHQAGFENVVSPMGTALTEHHLYLLKRLTRSIVLALDPDAAGDKATLRGLDVARKAMDHEQDPVFDARGLLRYEARLQADIRVTTLPDGLDPDEVVAQGKDAWEKILEEAKPVVVHVMETLAAGRDLEDPKVKTEIATRVLPLIEDLGSPIERDTYRQRLARLIRVDERTLFRESARSAARKPARQQPEQQGQSKSGRKAIETLTGAQASLALEAHCLGVLMRRPDLLYKVDRHLQESGLGRLSLEDFQSAEHRTIYQFIQSSVDQDDTEPLNYVLGSLSLPLMDVADELLEKTEKLDPVEDRVLEDLMRALLDLRRRMIYQNLDQLRFLQEEAHAAGDWMALEYHQSAQQFREAKKLIDRAMGRYTSRMSIR
jgi:DNA primase